MTQTEEVYRRMEVEQMMSVEEALERVLAHFRPLEAEDVPLLGALDRVLAEDALSPINIPPLDNTAMDGYALRAVDTAGAGPDNPVWLRVTTELAAGYVAEETVAPGTAVRIMTGAPIPPGADAVAEFEVVDREGDEIVLRRPIALDRNVRHAGEDVRQGEMVLSSGTFLRPAEVGVLASLGRTRVRVVRRPRVAILSTGDEVAAPGEALRPGQIYDANGYSVAAQTVRCGGEPILLGVARDRREELASKLAEGLSAGADLLITSGGVSVGDFDMVKEVLAAEGRVEFWLVRMKPGKPLAFGLIRGVPLLGLPGNPVSAMVSFETFARPAILKMSGRTAFRRPQVEARLVDGLRRKDGRRHYLRVRVSRTGDGYEARLTGDQGSGILTSMALANGLAVVSEERSWLPPGAAVPVILFDQPEESW